MEFLIGFISDLNCADRHQVLKICHFSTYSILPQNTLYGIDTVWITISEDNPRNYMQDKG